MDYGYDLHTRTQFIKDKNIICFQTTDGDIICLQVYNNYKMTDSICLVGRTNVGNLSCLTN